MSDILANVRVPPAVLVLALTGCGAAHDLAGVQRSIRRLTSLHHEATAAAMAAGLGICGHELDRGLVELPA